MKPGILTRKEGAGTIALYSLEAGSRAEVFVASTEGSRRILTRPECLGVPFQRSLSSAIDDSISALLNCADSRVGGLARHRPSDVLYILRGGLNFDLHNSLSRMLNYSPEVSFLTSQRTIHGATLQITENDYAKWSLQDNAILWVGDISATGTTISHVLKTTLKRYREKQLRPGWLVFVTIGTLDSLRGILCAFDAGELDFEGMSIVFLEGVFTLYKGSAALDRIHLPYTDLIRKNAPCAPEFERESLKTVQAFLERCVVYDGGSRAFEPLAYARGIKKYWASLAGLDGWTLEAVLDIHCNVLDYRKPYEEWAAGPFGGDQESLYDLGRSVLQGAMESDLCSICVRRLKTLRDAFGRIGLRLS